MCDFHPLEGLPSPTVVIFCRLDYLKVVGVSWGGPHHEAKKPSELHFYVFPFLLGVRGSVFHVCSYSHEVFPPPICCHSQGLHVFSSLLRGFRPPAVVILCRCDCL